MPFEVKAEGGDSALQRFDEMVGKIEQTATKAMPDEMYAWQAEDMNRDRPNMEITGWSVMTRIWPRSRRSMQRKARPRHEPRRHLRGLRPILRPELFEQLRERMREMLKRELTWR